GSHLTINDNEIYDMNSAGIYISDNDDPSPYPPTDITVSGNIISWVNGGWMDSEGAGIYVGTSMAIDTMNPSPVIGNRFTYNDIDGCLVGMFFLNSADNEVYYNNIENGLNNYAPTISLDILDAEYNYWGTDEPSEIALLADGIVDYYPWLQNAIEDPNFDSWFYSTGDTVTVTVYDPYYNEDPIRTDTIPEDVDDYFDVYSTTDEAGFEMKLTETGINTGLFTESFPLVEPVEPGPLELGVNDEDIIYFYGYPLAIVDNAAPVITTNLVED
ncbi:unnamed protein product, partial [marine sediment metagenome]